MSRPSPLHDVHVGLGAAFTDFAGWSMPLRYTSELAEHRGIREAAGVFDLSHMGELRVTGPAAAAFLDAALVGRASAMPIGRAAYGMVVDEAGLVLDDIVTYRLGETEFLVVANAANADVVRDALQDRVSGFDATVTDEGLSTALVAVQGPLAAAALAPLVTADLDALGYYRCVRSTLTTSRGPVEVLLARTGYTGEDGFELFSAADDATAVWTAVLGAVAPVGGIPAGLACRDTLRLEAGMPLYGHELSASRSPYEAGLGRVVKLDKTEPWTGAEALRRRAVAEPDEVLVGLRGTGRRAPRQGYRILSGESEVGGVTSGALSPTLGYPIAMGYVSAAHAGLGSVLDVDVRGTRLPVEVVALPFYRRAR